MIDSRVAGMLLSSEQGLANGKVGTDLIKGAHVEQDDPVDVVHRRVA